MQPPKRQHGHDLIVIGTSAGGVSALMRLVSGLPPDLPAAVLIAMHMPAQAPSVLPKILSRAGVLPAKHPADGEKIERGRIYCALPGVHLVVERDHLRLTAGPRENLHRPAIDPLFRTAAVAYGTRVIGVVLTGALNDGTAGLLAIKRRGGLAVVQDPDEALMPSMPANALAYVKVDQCLSLAQIPAYLVEMARTPAPPESDALPPADMQLESDMTGLRPQRKMRDGHFGELSTYTCPECKGPLWEVQDGELLRFRCQVGHAYTSDALLYDQAEAVDDALWTALETLEQRADVAARLAARSREYLHHGAAARYEAQESEMRKKIETLRQALLGGAMREALLNKQDEAASAASEGANANDGSIADDKAAAERID